MLVKVKNGHTIIYWECKEVSVGLITDMDEIAIEHLVEKYKKKGKYIHDKDYALIVDGEISAINAKAKVFLVSQETGQTIDKLL